MVKSFIGRIITKLRRKGPDFNDVQHVLELFKQGAYGEAYDDLREIMEKEPALSEAEMAFSYVLRADLALSANEDVGEAQVYLDKARELRYPDTAYYYRIRGDVKMRSGDPQGAIEYYEKSVALEPAVVNLIMLAQALSSVQDTRAREVWNRVIKSHPQNCLAHLGLALEAARSGDQEYATSMVKKAERLNPSADDVFWMGCVYQTMGEFQAAVSTYLRAEGLGCQKKGRLYAGIAACYYQLGQAEEARQFAESAFTSDSQDEYVKVICQNILGGTA